jgi:hypothetical protein
MATWRLVVGLAFAVVSAVLFGYAGRVQMKRQVMGEARLALQLFAIWWYALAAITVVGSVFNILAGLGKTDIALWQVYTYLAIAGICLALWGLLYYLLYLFTGNRAWLPILSIFYIFVYVLVLYFVQVSQPIGVKHDEWSAQLEYANQQDSPISIALVLFIIAPQILAGLAYFSLFFRVRERAQRFRIAIVSWSIVAWFSSSLVVAFSPELQTSDGWQVTSRLIGLTAASLIVMAYRPPRGIQRWLDAGAPAASDEGSRLARGGPVRKTRPLSSLAHDLMVPVRQLFRAQPVGALF